MGKKGKEAFLKQFEADPQYAAKAPPLQKLAWEYRDIFGDDIKDCKEGFLYYEVELGHTMQGLNKPHFINQGPIKKAAMRRYLEVYEDAGVVSKTHKEAYSNAFLIKKPGHTAEHQDQMDDATFSKQWRLILDLSSVNGNISDYATEPQTIAGILEEYKPQELQASVDILRTFH